MQKPFITEEENDSIKAKTQISANNYRGIADDTLRFFGVRTEFEDDEVSARYYPLTVDDVLSGYKVREHPKQFFTVGNVGNDCDLFGAFRFRAGGKYVLIVEGEEDCLAAYQMFKEYATNKGVDYMPAVVSLSTGVGGSTKQLANNYEFLNNFDNIVVGIDNDEAGNDALEKIILSLPKGKIKIAKWSKYKDPNEYLKNNAQQKFLRDFYDAETYVPAGIVGSNKIYDKMLDISVAPKLKFPPIMKGLNKMFNDGLTLRSIVNIAADTGIGKTSLVNEIIYYWIFHSPYKIGIVSMELDVAQYGEAMFSRHISRKLALMPDAERIDFLNSPKAKEAAKILFETEEGSPRFYVCEDRDGTVEQLQEVIEQMIISSGCKVIVLDPLQDVLDGLSNEEQAVFMKWSKSMIKSHGVLFVFINHKRKSQANSPGGMDEADIMGSSTIIKSAAVNILLRRDKQAEDEHERNTTYITVSKNRMCGLTGPADELYYDNFTHTLHNKAEYFGTNS